MENVVLKEEDVPDRTKWKNDIQNRSGDPRWREKPEEKESFLILRSSDKIKSSPAMGAMTLWDEVTNEFWDLGAPATL